MNDAEKILRQVRQVIRELREEEASIQSSSSSRSTGYRNRYKAGYTAVADIERIVKPTRRKKK